MTKTSTIKFEKEAEKQYEKRRKDKRAMAKINDLLKSISESYDNGVGKPERLKGYGDRLVYSRHINQKDRLKYEVFIEGDGTIVCIILTLKGHYDDH